MGHDPCLFLMASNPKMGKKLLLGFLGIANHWSAALLCSTGNLFCVREQRAPPLPALRGIGSTLDKRCGGAGALQAHKWREAWRWMQSLRHGGVSGWGPGGDRARSSRLVHGRRQILLCGWLARAGSFTRSFTHLSKKGSATMAVCSESVIYTVFSKMALIFASRCVSPKLQVEHLIRKLEYLQLLCWGSF